MIAGGTGIAPMLQVARDILKSSDDQVHHLVTRFYHLVLPQNSTVTLYFTTRKNIQKITHYLDKYKLDICQQNGRRYSAKGRT